MITATPINIVPALAGKS